VDINTFRTRNVGLGSCTGVVGLGEGDLLPRDAIDGLGTDVLRLFTSEPVPELTYLQWRMEFSARGGCTCSSLDLTIEA
jgi:hypothetical protein